MIDRATLISLDATSPLTVVTRRRGRARAWRWGRAAGSDRGHRHRPDHASDCSSNQVTAYAHLWGLSARKRRSMSASINVSLFYPTTNGSSGASPGSTGGRVIGTPSRSSVPGTSPGGSKGTQAQVDQSERHEAHRQAPRAADPGVGCLATQSIRHRFGIPSQPWDSPHLREMALAIEWQPRPTQLYPRCRHQGAELCLGPVSGFMTSAGPGDSQCQPPGRSPAAHATVGS